MSLLCYTEEMRPTVYNRQNAVLGALDGLRTKGSIDVRSAYQKMSANGLSSEE